MEAHRLTHPLKFKVAFLSKKVMASVFWDRESGLMIEYLERAPLLMESIMLMNYTAYVKKSRKRRGKLRNGVHLLQDNAPAHTSKVAMAAEKEFGYKILTHPPFSQDLAPSDYFLFPKSKESLRKKKFDSKTDVI